VHFFVYQSAHKAESWCIIPITQKREEAMDPKEKEIAELKAKLEQARNGLFSVHASLRETRKKDREAVVRMIINARMAASIALHLSTPE
jgi:hypothetical protein